MAVIRGINSNDQYVAKSQEALEQSQANKASELSLASQGLANNYQSLLNQQLEQEIASAEAESTLLANLSQQYLNTWNTMLQSSSSLYNTAAESVQGILANAQGNSADIDAQIDSAIADVNKSLSDFSTTYGGLQGAAIDTALAELSASKDLTTQLQELATADTEGEATKAKADVASESSAARAKMADNLIAMGADPTSGAGRSMMRESMDAEALNKVLAANTARATEKDRAAGTAATALNSINPSDTAGIASEITANQRALMGGRNNLVVSGAAAKNKALQTQGDIAGNLATIAKANADTASQQGEFGAALLGASLSS